MKKICVFIFLLISTASFTEAKTYNGTSPGKRTSGGAFSMLAGDDAGITAVTSLSCAGLQNVIVTLKNYGSNTLTAVTVNWTVNAIAQPVYNWNGSLAPNTTTDIVIGTYSFSGLTNYTISAATSLPNGNADGATGNDSYTSGTLQTALSGIYTVGAGKNFTTLTAATAAANAYGLCGPTTFSLTDAAYLSETLPVTVNIPSPSNTNRLTIQPAAGVTSTIRGNASSAEIIKVLSSYVTIDGSNNNSTDRSLVIENTSPFSPNEVNILSTTTTPVGYVTLKNCTLINGSNLGYSDAVFIGTFSNPFGTGYFNDITIQNNSIQKSYSGISAVAFITGTNGSNLLITQNDLIASSPGNQLVGFGIYTQGVNGSSITNNNIANLSNSLNDDFAFGIWLNNGTSNCMVSGNKISNITYSGSAASASRVDAVGVRVSGGANNIIENNSINNISETSTAGWAASGIELNSASGSLNGIVRNNFISNVYAYGFNAPERNGYGIRIAYGSGYKVYNNTISLSTNQISTAGLPAAISVSNTAGSIDLRNNIFSNAQTVGANKYAIYCTAASTAFTNIDYNDYYTTGANLGYIGTDRATLANVITGFGGNTNAVNVLPSFVSLTDLHLTAYDNCGLDGYGIPIAGITTDYDGQTRDANAPDMGADEFTPVYSNTLAADNYGVTAIATKALSAAGTTYVTPACELIATVLPAGAYPVSGVIKTAVTRDASNVPLFYNASPYVTRHYDIEPAVSTGSTTATITLYFTDEEFVDYNNYNPSWPQLPTSALGDGDPNKANIRITQYLGTPLHSPSGPADYSAGTTDYIDPDDNNITWNGYYWSVSFDISAGFSGFYLYTSYFSSPLPITLNYLRGIKQGTAHNLSWSVTCNSTPTATLILERSANGADFKTINSINVTALRCQQPFDYADVTPLAGTNYYRLKMIDANGKISYSNIVTLINATKGLMMVNIAPNPVVNGQFKLNISAAQQTPMEVVITDMAGRVVSRKAISLINGFNTVDMNASKLAGGTYQLYGNTTEGRTTTLRFVKR